MEIHTKERISLSTYFFISGICFSSWASRIPTLKMYFDLNEAELGNLLLLMPISSLLGLPFSGWLVSKFNSRKPLIFSFIGSVSSLTAIGFSNSITQLTIAILVFAFCVRILNIAINTQSVALQKKFTKKIIGSLHGLWSMGGIAGVGITTILIHFKVPIHIHLFAVSFVLLIVAWRASQFLIYNDKPTTGTKIQFGKPNKTILILGLIVFFAAICEGGMFDWSGVYFKEVLKEEIFTIGYFTYMVCMTISRFVSDKIVDAIGAPKTYLLSALFVCIGISIAVLFPYYWMALLGFSIVGLGIASFIPLTYALASKATDYAHGLIISIITTYIIVGMLIGPPLIGYLAHIFNLRWAFLLFVFVGLLLIPTTQSFFKFSKNSK